MTGSDAVIPEFELYVKLNWSLDRRCSDICERKERLKTCDTDGRYVSLGEGTR